MDPTCLLLALIVNINLNVILALPQQSSIKETNGPGTSTEEGFKNANSNIRPPASLATAQSQGLNRNVPQSLAKDGYYAIDGLQEQKFPSERMRNRRSYDQTGSVMSPKTAEELTALLLSKQFSKGQNLDSFFRLLSLLTAKPAAVDDSPDTDFSEEDPIDLLYGKRPPVPVYTHSNIGKDSYGDDIPIPIHTNHKNANGRLRNMQKRHDMIQNNGRLYSLGQLLQNSQNFDSGVPVYRRPIL